MDGELAEAGARLHKAVLISQAAGIFHMGIMTNSNLADVLMEQGQLHSAAKIYSRLYGRQPFRMTDFSIGCPVYAGLSRVSYEWNELERPQSMLASASRVSRRWGASNSRP